jgi:hypothetical protein
MSRLVIKQSHPSPMIRVITTGKCSNTYNLNSRGDMNIVFNNEERIMKCSRLEILVQGKWISLDTFRRRILSEYLPGSKILPKI